jgi:hypothetical protein
MVIYSAARVSNWSRPPCLIIDKKKKGRTSFEIE